MDERADWRRHAAEEISVRRAEMRRQLEAAERALDRAMSRVSQVRKEIGDLEAGARVLGLDIVASDAVSASVSEVSSSGAASVPPVKDIVINLLSDAYPSAMRTREIKAKIEQIIGRTIHEKTPGMTLYRLSEEGKVRRQGRDWYLVPQDPSGLQDDLSDLLGEEPREAIDPVEGGSDETEFI